MKTAVVLILAVLAQAGGNVLLTRGMKAAAALSVADGHRVTGALSPSVDTAVHAVQRPDMWAGTVLLIIFFALYSAALSWADLSFVLPATAVGYVLDVAAARFFLGEAVTPTRWIGSLIITIGVVLVSRSGQSTTPAAANGPAR